MVIRCTAVCTVCEEIWTWHLKNLIRTLLSTMQEPTFLRETVLACCQLLNRWEYRHWITELPEHCIFFKRFVFFEYFPAFYRDTSSKIDWYLVWHESKVLRWYCCFEFCLTVKLGFFSELLHSGLGLGTTGSFYRLDALPVSLPTVWGPEL